MSENLAGRVRSFLSRCNEAATAAAVTRALREPSEASVHRVLAGLRDIGEVVSSRVVVEGVETERFRLAVRRDVRQSVVRGERTGRPITRQRDVLDFMRRAGRPVFTREIVEHFVAREPGLPANAIHVAMWALRKKGEIAFVGKRPNPRHRFKCRSPLYATRELAGRDVDCSDARGSRVAFDVRDDGAVRIMSSGGSITLSAREARELLDRVAGRGAR